jgi:hypothetical protein
MILIQCVASKKDETCKAKHLYDSTYFERMREYAEATGEPWKILSAKHGLVDPEETLAPYDAFGLSNVQCKRIAAELDRQDVDSVRVIAGKKYVDPLTPELEAKGIDVVELCRGQRIGERLKTLKTMTKEVSNHTLC